MLHTPAAQRTSLYLPEHQHHYQELWKLSNHYNGR